MTVEHARTLHSPNQHIHTLNDRVWRLERERCDCTKIPTSQPKDIVLAPPQPPSPVAEGVMWGLRLGWGEHDIMRLRKSDWVAEPTGHKAVSNVGFVYGGWSVIKPIDSQDGELLVAHLDNRYPPKRLIGVTDSDGLAGRIVWHADQNLIAVGKRAVPLFSTDPIVFDADGPGDAVPGGGGVNTSGQDWVLYVVDGGSVVESARFTPPRSDSSQFRWMASRSVFVDLKTTTTGSVVAEYDVETYYRSGTRFERADSKQFVVAATQRWVLGEGHLYAVSSYGDLTAYQLQDQELLGEIQRSGSSGTRLYPAGEERVLVMCSRRSFLLHYGDVELRFDNDSFGIHIYQNIG